MDKGKEIFEGIIKNIAEANARNEYMDLLSESIMHFMVARYVGIKNFQGLGFESESEVDDLIQNINDAAKGFLQKSIDENDERFLRLVKELEDNIFVDVKVNVICV